ncbi:hypothetical protein ABIF96_005820 [Bradyrhizobium ottawaense]
MLDSNGPTGFRHIETAPLDGRYLRLRFQRREDEAVGRWQRDNYLKSGGFWADGDGCYITPGPIFWAPITHPHS